MTIPPTAHAGTIIHFTGGPPGKNVDMSPLMNWVKVAAPILPITVLAVNTRIVPTGIDINAYSPGSGAGMKAVVKVLRDDRHPKMDIRARSLDEKYGSFKLDSTPWQNSSYSLIIETPLPSTM